MIICTMTLRRLLILFCSVLSTTSGNYPCTDLSAIQILRRSTYDFSIGILDRIREDLNGNFVFSPVQTWVQLTALAEGVSGRTAKEIMEATNYQQQLCFRRKFLRLLKSSYEDLGRNFKNSDVLLVNKDPIIVDSYNIRINTQDGFNVTVMRYDENYDAADNLNQLIADKTNGQVTEVLVPEDFKDNYFKTWDDNSIIGGLTRSLLVVDAAYYKPAWRFSFASYETKLKPFYSEDKTIDNVSMMHQTGLFNLTHIPSIKTKVLELPCDQSSVSMLIFLPTEGYIDDMYTSLKSITLATVYNKFSLEGIKPVNVELPRFKIYTDFDNLPEVISDMGIERIFKKNTIEFSWAEFDSISEYPTHVSLMTQVSAIEIAEDGAESSSEIFGRTFNFIANKPFAFMVVHRETKIILFSGIYSKPSE